MSKEIDDLFEINLEENLNYTNTKIQNFSKHFLIHLCILLSLIVLSYTFIDTKDSPNDGILIDFIFLFLFLTFFVVLIVEVIYYQIKSKFQLRNSALFLIFLFFITIIGIIFYLGLF